MKFLKTLNIDSLNFSARTSEEKLELIALEARKIHQSLFCGGDLQCHLDQMYHFKNGRNYYGGKTLENIKALKGLIEITKAQKFDAFNAIPAILLNLQFPKHQNRVDAIISLSTGMTLNRQITCTKDTFFLSVLDFLPLHNMFALIAGDELKTLNDGTDGKLMSNNEIQALNTELPYFQLVPAPAKFSDQILIQITADEKLLKALNEKIAQVDVGRVYGQYAGLNINHLRNRLAKVA